jgi:hypothetical protein
VAWWTVSQEERARWDESYAEAWLIVTDLAPEAANIVWYSMRTWIECGFKDTKRGGGPRHQTKMKDPERAARLWVAIAVATFWVVSVGGQAEATATCSGLEALPEQHIARRTATQRSRPRLSSCFGQGIRLILVALLQQQGCPVGCFRAEPSRSDQSEKEQESGAEATLATGASTFQGGCMKNLPWKGSLPPRLLPITIAS